jgi:magnesium-transporting ATPase (P-type)
MIGNILVAIAAGFASASMFASIVSGALVSLLLLYLAPLPLMVAALGWSPFSAAIGGATAAAILGLAFGLHYCIAFIVAIALPAWWLGHVTLLGRPHAGGSATTEVASALEWYPLGRILLWIVIFAAITTFATLLAFGSDASTIHQTMRAALLRIVEPAEIASSDRRIDAVTAIAPGAAAIAITMTLTLNLWLAARIAATSGQFCRPWPDLKSTALPPLTLAALCAAIAFCFSGGLLAILAQIACAALMIAYALTGFAVLHTVTIARKNRAVWLICSYALVLVFSWPLLLMAALGVADVIFGLRKRYLRARQPPLSASKISQLEP